MKNRGKFILTFVITFIVVVILGAILFYSSILPIQPVRLASSNMAPAYEKGEILFVKQTNDYRVNDVIIADIIPNKIVTRIIAINDDGTFSAKGDHNSAQLKEERSFTEDRIIGEVVSKASAGLFYSCLYAINILLALLITLGIYSNIKNKNKEKK